MAGVRPGRGAGVGGSGGAVSRAALTQLRARAPPSPEPGLRESLPGSTREQRKGVRGSPSAPRPRRPSPQCPVRHRPLLPAPNIAPSAELRRGCSGNPAQRPGSLLTSGTPRGCGEPSAGGRPHSARPGLQASCDLGQPLPALDLTTQQDTAKVTQKEWRASCQGGSAALTTQTWRLHDFVSFSFHICKTGVIILHLA